MSLGTLTTGIIFALQTGVGILGNIFLLSCYVFMSRSGQRLKDIDLVLDNLVLANCLVLLSRGIPQTMLSLGLKNFLNDFGCKLVFYLHRVARAMSLGATCILSCLQAIKIISSSTWWMKVKALSVKYTQVFITLCWMLHMLINSVIINHITGPRKSSNRTEKVDLGYCSGIRSDRYTYKLYSVIFSFMDVLALGCMLCASGFMVFVLYKHKQNVLYMQKKNFPPKFSAEKTATQSILLLASMFFSLYSLSLFFAMYVSRFEKPSPWLVDTSSLLAANFPSLSPFLLMSRDPRIYRLFLRCCAKMNCSWKLFRVS